MSNKITAKVMTVAIVGAMYFGGNFEKARELQQLLNKSATENGRRAKPRNGFIFLLVARLKLICCSSSISQMLPKPIHAVTPKGFELKVMLFVLALNINLWVAT